ncbi:MAG: hypothetical protein IKH57_02445 [Clostridia bacterium]|nr:hypothetical protein [Clostridia bacterium]
MKETGEMSVAQGAEWKVIHMAHSEKNAREILALLEGEGILARAKQVYRAVSSEENCYEIMVLGSEAVEARQMLIEHNLLM